MIKIIDNFKFIVSILVISACFMLTIELMNNAYTKELNIQQQQVNSHLEYINTDNY